jgi:flagellar hook protein FlgE
MLPIDTALQGLVQAQKSLDKTAGRIARSGMPSGAGADSVSLSDEAVSLMTAKNAYEMNLRTLKASDEMTGKLLDMLA